MKIPRDVSAVDLIKRLEKIGYSITRQKGSHIRLTKQSGSEQFHITIPNHDQLKIGTLNNILNSLSINENITKDELIKLLFT
ncbi:MAG: type II toxin-antitoxin system HicA family toxin [Ignavibacteriales bacterium]|nr:type II toxin-antitoxin system HicA family toxin [Ignavibacteriales bacterium]